jgi:tRNA U34 5-methylaminomethyl-2-thiouridine-forming methyltransferase MnmC
VTARSDYRIVKLASGAYSIHSLAEKETFHPVIGPTAEAEALYVNQPRIKERLARHLGEFVIWDVGLGAAANPITVLRATESIPSLVQIVSFDHTLAPLEFALQHQEYLPYLSGYEVEMRRLLEGRCVDFIRQKQKVHWEVHVADFPGLLSSAAALKFPKPHLVLFDAFSPTTNPAMWTAPLFSNLFHLLDPERGCILPTYSRSTMLRVTLLLAGFFVGRGHPTGEKEETTVAANQLGLLEEPLDRSWLQRAHRSTSAEPLWRPVYSQAPLSPQTWSRLQAHPQFG